MRALLALEDGSLYHGRSAGAAGRAVGEVVFNTAMTGYQEILTDPSYARQLVTLTYPHIGNTGCNAVDQEAERAMAAGLIVRDDALRASSWRASGGLGAFLTEQTVVAIAGIDTRSLTRKLREQGAMNGCILAAPDPDPDEAVAAARGFPGLAGMDLAGVVSTERSYEWTEGRWDLDATAYAETARRLWHVVAYDFGIKRNILRMLAERGCRVTVVPARTPAAEALALNPHGVFLSNGPGDPEPCDYAIEATRELLTAGLPLFGICLGHQILGLAAGGRTMKMKFGHHGANHPVRELATGRVLISSQNHGFAVDETRLPAELEATHRSLFDGTLQGMRARSAPAFSFQGHPEASPGPHDVGGLFDEFVELMREHAGGPPAGESG